MATRSASDRALAWTLGGMVVLLYIFLYLPIIYISGVSFSSDVTWPFPFQFSWDAYSGLLGQAQYTDALWNSLELALGAAIIATLVATAGTVGILRRRTPWGRAAGFVFILPLFVANLIIGIASLVFDYKVLNVPGNMSSAIVANSIHCTAFAFLILLSQLVRYDWRYDDAATVFGATPWRCFWTVTLPNIWPAVLGAFLISFILAFNNLEISFYTLGATPTLPSVAWGQLRYGLKPELFALAALTNGLVFVVFVVMYVLMRTRLVTFGHRE